MSSETVKSPLLKVENLNAWYAESQALHGMSFEVPEGELVTLIGRNGAGKSTTLRSIMGIVRKRKGSIRFRGEELIGKQTYEIARQGIAYCPEERAIFASLSVRENLGLPPVSERGRLHRRGTARTVPQPARAPEQHGHHALGW
jgi:branched-chain amino acid transport system ATP-binding protein